MANLIEWIKEIAGDEDVKDVVIGGMGWAYDYNSEKVPNYSKIPKNVVLNWEEAKKYLNYEFDDGSGSPKCNAVYAWTKKKIIFVVQYDGSTFPCWVPRNPGICTPIMPGG